MRQSRPARSPTVQTSLPGTSRHRRDTKTLTTLAIAIAIAITITVRQLEQASAAPGQLPATPRGWLGQFSASILENPHEVCARLFSPELAAAYDTGRGVTCTSVLTHATSTPCAVRRVPQYRGTAVIELRQALQGSYWAVVLNRRDQGCRAADLIGGTTQK
jgi:hypothetical protein